MKRQIAKLAAVGTMAAGMIFAQAQTAPQGQPNSQVQAQKGERARQGFEARRAEGRQKFMQALNLTPDQKTAAKAIFGQARELAKPVRMELHANRQALSAAVKADNRAQIEKLSAERGRLTAKLTENRGQAMAKFYQVLTPAQRAKADQMHARVQARMREMRNAHRGTRANG